MNSSVMNSQRKIKRESCLFFCKGMGSNGTIKIAENIIQLLTLKPKQVNPMRKRHQIMRFICGIPVYLFFLTFSGASKAEIYDYPFNNPYIATIVGTPKEYRADILQNITIRTGTLEKEIGPKIPDIFWYQRGLEYSFSLQKGKAPLVFVIAGTGADHKSEKNIILLRAFYQAGFHVVGLTSPSHHSFITTASRTSVPGHMEEDSEDLYFVMQRVMNDIKGEADISSYFLTGYSLGGAHAAFISKIDEDKNAFNFDQVLLLNPPLSMYSSVSKLDRMLENIPGGVDHFNKFFNQLVRRISKVYNRSSTVEFNETLVFDAFKDDPPRDEQLAAIIGTAFRFSAANMVFAADTMTDFGFVKSEDIKLKTSDSLQDYLRLCMRIGFTDYFHEFFFPYFKKKYPSLTRESLVNQLSLLHIESYLRGATKISLVHNRDDVILVEGDIGIFEDIFGSRAKFFPTGGHLGNLQQRETLAYIVNSFKEAGSVQVIF